MKDSIKDKIRLAWVVFSPRWGGPEQVAMGDMVDLVQAGVSVHLICLEGSPIHAAGMRHPGLNLLPFTQGPRGRFDTIFMKELRAALIDCNANILHVHDERLLWFLEISLYKQPQISLVASRHSLVQRGLPKLVRSILLRRLDYMIVLSSSIKDSVVDELGVSEKKLRVINLGLDFSRFDPAKSKGKELRTQWGADKDTIVIGSVGRLIPEVGQDTFLKAAASLLKYRDRPDLKMKFVIIGEDPLVTSEEYVQELKDLTRTFHIEDAVTFGTLGDNLPDVMSAFDIFVMAGREDVPGLGALEALAMERPVVLSKVSGAEDIVGENNEFGLLVRPEDAFDLQEKILKLLENPSQRLAMGTNGRRYVLKHFDKRTRLFRTLGVYEKCIKRRFALHGPVGPVETLTSAKS